MSNEPTIKLIADGRWWFPGASKATGWVSKDRAARELRLYLEHHAIPDSQVSPGGTTTQTVTVIPDSQNPNIAQPTYTR